MRGICLSAGAGLCLILSLQAARAADVTSASYDWTGFYAGLNAGVAWNNSEIKNSVDAADNFENGWSGSVRDSLTGDETAFTGGAAVGYNWQTQSLVVGVEADINYIGFGDDLSRDLVNLPDFSDTSHDLSFEANWFGTLRGRLGFAADNMLFYGTGGLAYGHLEVESDARAYSQDKMALLGAWEGSLDQVNWGWSIGAGMEYGIDNWSLGIEYLYIDLGESDWDADNEGIQIALDAFKSEGSVDYQFSVVRATAKLRF